MFHIPYLDKGLDVLRHQLKMTYAGIVIGWIADDKHDAKSDHEPSTEKHDEGAVDAIDPMVDGVNYTAVDARRDINAIVESRDPRVAYIIYQGQILSSTIAPWTWRKYYGKDQHFNHWHISVNDKHETDVSLWSIYKPNIEEPEMNEAQFKDWFVTTLSEIGNAALPDGNTAKVATTQIGRNGLVYFRRILSPLLAADNEAVANAVVAKIPTGTITADTVKAAILDVLRHGVGS